MKTFAVVIVSLIAFSGIGHAADITAPVREIMEATKSNWADNNSDWTDIFDASRLDHLYSRDFVARYQAAAQFPAVDNQHSRAASLPWLPQRFQPSPMPIPPSAKLPASAMALPIRSLASIMFLPW